MKWNYKCPLCGEWRQSEWKIHGENSRCKKCNKVRSIPTPAEQHDAFVDGHDCPDEMRDVVLKEKGKTCIIKGCENNDIEMDHIKAWHNQGKTKVENLQPMCKSHNSSKSDDDFKTWLKDNNYKTR